MNHTYHSPQVDKYRHSGNRIKALKRDKFSCRKCGKTHHETRLDIHHKDETGRNKKIHNNKLNNLITLCISCHTKLHIAKEKKRIKMGFDPRQSKLTGRDVLEIRKHYQRYRRGYGCITLGRKYGVTPSNILSIVKRESWKYI